MRQVFAAAAAGGLHNALTPSDIGTILGKANPDIMHVFGNAASGVDELVGTSDPYRDLVDSGTISKEYASALLGGTVDRIDADTGAYMRNSDPGFCTPTNAVIMWVGVPLSGGPAGITQHLYSYRKIISLGQGIAFYIDHTTGYLSFIVDAGASQQVRTVSVDHRDQAIVALGVRNTVSNVHDIYTTLGSSTGAGLAGSLTASGQYLQAGAFPSATTSAAYAEHGIGMIWENNTTAWSDTERAALQDYLGV